MRGRSASRRRRRAPRVEGRRLGAALIALLAALGLWLVATSDEPRIARVTVSGARHVSPEQAREASALVSAPLFRASAARAREALLGISAVRDARAEIAVPSGAAHLTLVEREAVGRWVVGAVEWFVDRDGVLFSSVDAAAAPALRVRDLRTSSRSAGDRLDPALVAAALRLAAVAPGELRADATAPAVRIEPGTGGIVLSSGAGWEVRFGSPERIDEKLALAKRALRDRGMGRLEYVDVRTPEFIVIK